MIIDDTPQPFQADEAITAIPQDSDFEEVLALNLAAAEIEAFDDALVEASQTTDTFIELDHALAQTVSEGGLAPVTADAIRMAVEQLVDRMDFEKAPKVFPSMENFKDPYKRVQATKVAMEGLKETAIAILEGIVKVCLRVLAAIGRFIDDSLRGWGSLRQRAERLLADAKVKAKGAMTFNRADLIPADEASRFTRVLCNRGEFKGGNAFFSDFTDFARVTARLKSSQNDMLMRGMSSLPKEENSLASRGVDDQFAVDCIRAINQGVSGNRMSKPAPVGCQMYEFKLPFGDRSFWSVIPAATSNDPETLKSMSFTVDAAEHYRGPKEQRQGVETMSDYAAKFLTSLIKDLKDAERSDQVVRQGVDAVYESYIVSLKRQIAELKGQHGETRATSNLQSMMAMSSGLSKIFTQGQTALTSYQMTVYRAALEYAAASLRVTQAS